MFLQKKERLFSSVSNICSETGQPEQERMFGYKEHMFSPYTHIRTYVLFALKDAPCFPRMLFVKIAKNPAESLALCPRFFVKFLLTFRV